MFSNPTRDYARHPIMPRVPTKKGQGNLTREEVVTDRITVFEDGRTRAGYLTQKPRVVSASARQKSPSKSPMKSATLRPRSPLQPAEDFYAQKSEPMYAGKATRTKGKVQLFLTGLRHDC